MFKSCAQDIANRTAQNQPVLLNATLQGTGPATLSSGANFSISDLVIYITIPGSIVDSYDTYNLDNSTTIQVVLGQDYFNNTLPSPGLGLNFTNAMPQQLDAARQFTASDASTPNPLQNSAQVGYDSSQDLTLALPNDGSLQVGPLTTGAGGTLFTVAISTLSGTVHASDANINSFYGPLIDFFSWTCTTDAPVALLS